MKISPQRSTPYSRRSAIVRLLGTAAAAAMVSSAGIPSASAESLQRIVVAGGDLTEIVFALGAGDQVIGVDSTSIFPPDAAAKEQIGYVRRLSSEGVLSLAPTMVLAAHDAGPETAMSQLEAAGVNVAVAPQAAEIDQIPEKIRFVGRVLNRATEAEVLARDFATRLAAVDAKIAKLEEPPKVLFILSLERGAPLVAGTETSADAIISRAGGTNATTEFTGYKPLSAEAIIAAAPDVILMMSQHAERSGGRDAVLERPDIKLTPAGQSGRLVTLEGMLLLGFGLRTPQAISVVARAFHPVEAERLGL